MSQAKIGYISDDQLAMLEELDKVIAELEIALGIKVDDLPQLTDSDHDRLALERINQFRTKNLKN